jgi:trimeric autotransporter adhesin
MSTKTTFKRIALVAVAALGLGVLSVAPSQAAVINLSATTVTVANGTATTAVSDSTTAATLRVTFTGENSTDSATINSYVSAQPAGSATAPALVVQLMDTATSTARTTVSVANTSTTALVAGVVPGATSAIRSDSITAVISPNSTGQVSALFDYFFATATGLSAGTYVITTVVTPFSNGVRGTAFTKDVSIVVSTAAADSTVANPTYSTLGDLSATVGLATVSATNAARATLAVRLFNASNLEVARESVTATITGPGQIGDASGVRGKSIVSKFTAGSALTLSVYSDGTAGVSTITVSTPSVTFPTRTFTFYTATPATPVATVNKAVIAASGTSTTDVVRAAIKDASGNVFAGDAYIYATSAASALNAGSETPALCTYDAADQRHECDITGKLVGTAKFKIINADTVAAATVSSNEVEVRVAVATAASVKIAFDKTTYSPGEKATLSVTVLDANGATLPGATYTNVFAAGGIASSSAFSAGSDTTTATQITLASSTSAAAGTTAGSQNYVVYMPIASGDVTVSATGGTGLPVAARVAVSATASVVNPSVDAATDAANEATDAANAATDAALAAADAADAATAAAQDASDAVAALSASVSKLISSLRAQITSLTNLVIKIQKKVRA